MRAPQVRLIGEEGVEWASDRPGADEPSDPIHSIRQLLEKLPGLVKEIQDGELDEMLGVLAAVAAAEAQRSGYSDAMSFLRGHLNR